MKKYLLWLLVIFLICSSAIIHIKGNVVQHAESKNFSFIVYKSIDYTSSVYNNTYVRLQIKVEKVSNKKRTLLLEKTYEPKLMSAYPMLDNAITHLITARNVPNSEANVEFTYTCTYKSKGYNLKIQNTAVIDQHSHSILDISI